MKEMIDWLKGVEMEAAEVYALAAEEFSGDKEFSTFLQELSRDEQNHYDLLSSAAESLKDDRAPDLVTLDDEYRRKIERPLRECRERLAEGGIAKKDVLNFIVVIEFSELNRIFLYAVNSLTMHTGNQDCLLAGRMDEHKGRIKDYIRPRPEYAEFLGNLDQFPKVASGTILIVEDSRINLDLLEAVLEKEGCILSATSANEALEILSTHDVSAVVTDVLMPVMDGVELYRKAVDRKPGLADRFVFFTASVDPAHADFFDSQNLRYIRKPSPLGDLRKAVREILST